MNDEYLKKLYSYLGSQDSEYHKRTTYDDFKSKMGGEDYSTKVHSYIKGIDSEFRSLEDFNSMLKKKSSNWGSTLGSGSSASQKNERKATKEIAKTKDLRNVADKGSEIFTGYPGKEKNQYEFSNGNWYELNPEVEKTIKKSKESYVPVGGLPMGGGMFVNPSGEGQDFATPGTSKNSLDAIKNVPKKRIIEDDARVKALNKQFGKNASLDEYYETFGDYDNSPEKKNNKYRIKNNSWERWVPGAQWSSITNEGSISALNRRYGKNIEAKKDIVVKPKEIDPFLKVNSNFLAQSEESAQQMLEKNFKGMGFTFEQTGVGGDYIKVIPNNGNEPQTFSFDNVGNSTRGALSSPTGMGIGNDNSEELQKNADQSVKLQSYLRFNASAEKEDDLSAANRIKNNTLSKKESNLDIKSAIENNKYYESEDYKNAFKELTFQQKREEIKRRRSENANLSSTAGTGLAGKLATAIFGEDEKYYENANTLKKFENKLNNSEEYKVFLSEQKKYDAQKGEKYDKLHDEWVIAKQSGNKDYIKTIKAKIEGGYSKDLIGDNLTHMTGTQYDLQRDINILNKRKEKLQLDAKNGNLTQEQYNDAVEGLSSEAQRLDVAAKNVAATQKKMNALAGVYVTEKAKSGGFFGNFTNAFVVAMDEVREPLSYIVPALGKDLSGEEEKKIATEAQTITPQQRQYYKDKGFTDEQIKNVLLNNVQKNAIAANKRAIIETFGSDLTTEESKQNLSFFEQALVGVAASLPSMLTRAVPIVGAPLAFASMANMSYNAINEEMLNDTDFETTSEADRAVVAVPYALVMGYLENIGLKYMTSGKSTLLAKAVLSTVAKAIPFKAGREVAEKVINKEVKSLISKGAIKIVNGTLVEGETGFYQAAVLDVGLKQLYNKLDLLDLKLTNKEGLTGGELFETPDTKMGVAGAILEGAAAEAIGGFAMSTVMTGSQLLINGKISLYNKEDLKFFEDFSSDQEFKKLIVSNLKTEMLNGTMTKGEAQSALNDIDLVEGVFNSIDENISDEAKIIAFNLINERNRLEKEVIGKDPALSKEKNDRIKDINDKLGTLPLQVLVVNNIERATKLENALKQKGAVIIDGETINRKTAQTELNKINQKLEDAVQKQATGQVPVQSTTTVGEEVVQGEPTTEPQGLTEEGKAEEVVSLNGLTEKNGQFNGTLESLVSISTDNLNPLNEDEEMIAWNNKNKAKKENNLTDKEWAESILDVPSSEDPIDATLKPNGKIVVTDGHHRLLAAKILGKDLSVNLKVDGYVNEEGKPNITEYLTQVSSKTQPITQIKAAEQSTPAQEASLTIQEELQLLAEEQAKTQVNKLTEGFKQAGEKSRDTKDASHIGRWMLGNSQKGDVIKFQDGGYEVTEITTKKDGTNELVLTPFEFNEDGTKEYNNSGIKIITEQSIKNGSNLFENAYTNSKGERVIEQSIYEPQKVKAEEVALTEKQRIEAEIAKKKKGKTPKYARNVAALITPATTRNFDATTKRMQRLSLKYDELVKKMEESKVVTNEDEKQLKKLENQILGQVKKEIVEGISKIKGVEVLFRDNYSGAWGGVAEPSMNMSLKITEDADTEAISRFLQEFGEKYSQDAIIIETTSEFSDDIINEKIKPKFSYTDNRGFLHYPQIFYKFASTPTAKQLADLGKLLKENGINDYSFNNNELKVSIISFEDNQTETQLKQDYEKRHEKIKQSVINALGLTKDGDVVSTEVRYRKSRYVGSENDGDTSTEERPYDRSDIFKEIKEDVIKAQEEGLELGTIRDKQIALQEKGRDLNSAEKRRLAKLTSTVQPIVQETFETKEKDFEEAKKEVESIADRAIRRLKGFVSKFAIKRPTRASVKTLRWYSADTEKLGDGARVNIIVPTNEEADLVFKNIDEGNKKDSQLRRINEATELGYPKRLIEIRAKNGVISEVQVMTPEGYLAKDGYKFFPPEQQEEAKQKLQETQQKFGWAIPDGLGHYFYEIERDFNVDKSLREEAKRLSLKYYNAFLNNVKWDEQQFADEMSAFKDRIDSDKKIGWDAGNEGKSPKSLDEFLNKEKAAPVVKATSATKSTAPTNFSWKNIKDEKSDVIRAMRRLRVAELTELEKIEDPDDEEIIKINELKAKIKSANTVLNARERQAIPETIIVEKPKPKSEPIGKGTRVRGSGTTEFSVVIDEKKGTAKVQLKKVETFTPKRASVEANLTIQTDEKRGRFVETKNKTKVYIDDVITPAKVEPTKAKVTSKAKVEPVVEETEIEKAIAEERLFLESMIEDGAVGFDKDLNLLNSNPRKYADEKNKKYSKKDKNGRFLYPEMRNKYVEFYLTIRGRAEAKAPVKEEVKNKVVLSAIQKDAYKKLSKKEKEIVDEIIFDENNERSIGAVDILDENLNEKQLEDEINRSAISFEDLLNMSLNISLPKTKISEGNEVFTFGKDKYDINKANEIISEESLEEINIPVDALPKMSYSFISVDENTVKNADITKPVILVRTKDGLLLIDGHHRVRKAIIENKPIKAFVLNESQTNQVKEQSTKKAEPVKKEVKAESVKEETEAEKISRGAEMLKNMSEDERDNFLDDWYENRIPRESLPGGSIAIDFYEAKKIVPNPTSKPKRTTGSLSMSQSFVINIDGVIYGLNKYEDPDATSDATDKYGEPKQYVWAYTDMSKGDEVIETFESDIDELINEIKSLKEEAPAPAKESTAEEETIFNIIKSIQSEINQINNEIEIAKENARNEVEPIRTKIKDLDNSNKTKDEKETQKEFFQKDIEDVEKKLKEELYGKENEEYKGLVSDLNKKAQELQEEFNKLGSLEISSTENKKKLSEYIDDAISKLNSLNKFTYAGIGVGTSLATMKLILEGINALVKAAESISLNEAIAKMYTKHKNRHPKVKRAQFIKEINYFLDNTFVEKKTNKQDLTDTQDRLAEFKQAVKLAISLDRKESERLRIEAERVVRKMLTGKVDTLDSIQMKSIMLRLAKFNVLSQRQYDKFIDYVDKIIGIADYDAKVTKANENRKTAKKNLPKLGDISSDLLDPLSRVLSINAKLIPSDVFESYAEIVEMLSKRDAVLKLNKRADLNESLDKIIESIELNEQRISDLKELYDNFAGKTADYAETLDEMLKVGIINQAEHKLMKTFKSKIQGAKVKEKMTEQGIADEKAELIDEVNNTTITLDEIVGNEFRLERDLVKRLQDLLKNKKTLERLNNKDLKDLLRVIDNINNGFVSNATQEMVEKLNFIEKSILLESSIPETFKVITARINQSLEKRISKRINVAPLFNIDQQLGDFKTKNIFNSIFNESAKAQQGYQSAITLIQDELDKIERGIATSFENEPNKIILSQFKMMVYMMQLEYDSNPNNNQVHQAMKTLDETIKFAKQNSEKSGYNELDIAQMESIKKEFEKNGEIDIDKLYKSFNEAEKNGLKKLEEINNRMTKFATYTATVINGKKIKSLKNYISYTVINESDILSSSETTDQINNINANMNPGTVSKNLEERDGKVHPVYLNPFYATNSSSRSVLLNYHMTEPVRTARKTLRNTKTLLEEKKGTTQEQYNILSAISGAYNTATKDLLESNFTQSNKYLEFIKRQGYRAMLASGTRAAAELSSNIAFVLLNNPRDMRRGVSKEIKEIEGVDRMSIMTNLKSTVKSRVQPTSLINSPFVELTTNANRSSKSKNTKTEIRNGVRQAWDETGQKYVDVVAGVADYLISKPDQVIMRRLWFGAFSRAFEKESGIKPDFDKIIKNDEEYMDKYKDALEKATTMADKQVVSAGSSMNSYMGILQNVVRQDDKGGVIFVKEFNRFMNKFTVQEYYTAREGVRALVGNGTISRTEGIQVLAAVTLRMTIYSVFTRLFSEGLAVVARSLGFGGDDDDDDKTAKQKISQGILSSITTLVFGRYFGNFIRVAENALIELANEEYGEAIGLRDGEYDPYKDAIQFNQLQEGKVDKLTDFVKVVAGPLSPVIGTAELAYKLATSSKPEGERAKLTREKELYRRLPLEIGGLAGVVPFYKDFRKIVMEGVYKELKKETKETAVKKEAKAKTDAEKISQQTSILKEMMDSGRYTKEGIKKELRKIKDPEYRKAEKKIEEDMVKAILDQQTIKYSNKQDFEKREKEKAKIAFKMYYKRREESLKILNELKNRMKALEYDEEYIIKDSFGGGDSFGSDSFGEGDKFGGDKFGGDEFGEDD